MKELTNLELLMEYMEQNQYFMGNDLLAKYNELLLKEKKELLGINVVSHSKNLNLMQTIENTKQLPQVQYDLQRQLRELRVMANKLGLYDAADFLTSYCG